MERAKRNKKVALAYACGMWTLITAYAVFRYAGPKKDKSVKSETLEEVHKEEDGIMLAQQTAHSKSVIIYKKDFVPYTTRMYNLINNFFSSGPGSGGVGK